MGTPDHDHMDEAMTDAHYLNQQRAWGDYDRKIQNATDLEQIREAKDESTIPLGEFLDSGKWRVEREADWLNGPYWIAWRPSEGWKGLAPKFRTHAEALAYADEQARTITVTLPKIRVGASIAYQCGNQRLEAEVFDDGYLLIEDMGDGDMVAIPPEWGEVIAPRLLALARKGSQ